MWVKFYFCGSEGSVGGRGGRAGVVRGGVIVAWWLAGVMGAGWCGGRWV